MILDDNVFLADYSQFINSRRIVMKRIILFLLFIIFVFLQYSENMGNLPGILKPEMLTVSGDELYVVQGARVHIYSLKDLSLKRTLGREGEGPGELKVAPNWYNNVTVLKTKIFIDGLDKVVFYSKSGMYLGEMKKPLGLSRMVPVGKNFVAVKLTHMEKDIQYNCLNLYNEKLEYVRELARQESPMQSVSFKTEMIPDVLNFSVWEDKIFTELSRQGFIIDVFDSQGDKLYRIKKPATRVPVDDGLKNTFIKMFSENPLIRQMGFQEFKRTGKLVWPEQLAPIRDIAVSDNRIYVRTYIKRQYEEWGVMDMRGNKIKKKQFPPVENAPLLAHLFGIKYYAIHNNIFYYIRENSESEDWELHAVKVN